MPGLNGWQPISIQVRSKWSWNRRRERLVHVEHALFFAGFSVIFTRLLFTWNTKISTGFRS